MRSHLAQDIHARNAHQRSIGTLGFRLTSADAITQQFAHTLQRPTVTSVVTKGNCRHIAITLTTRLRALSGIPDGGQCRTRTCDLLLVRQAL